MPQLGSRYTFAIIADPQVVEASTESNIGKTTQRNLSAIVDEINRNPSVSFVVFNGDMVQFGIPEHIDNFMSRAEKLKPMPILVHGNHDGSYPYPELRHMQKRLNGTEQAQFSFDVGNWHYVTFPCNLGRGRDRELELLQQLDADLSANRDRPVMVLEHLHLMPQGLTPLLWYTYSREFRNEILDVLTRYGNVRYVINGHIHNGIKASLKTAWTYQGINFITAPTCITSRNFGDEFPEFQKGITKHRGDAGGGYYLLVDVDGDEVTLRGRLVGVRKEFMYPETFTEYRDQEPIWFAPISAHSPHETFVNPSFDEGLEGWNRPYRYMAEPEPAYRAESVAVVEGTGKVAHLSVREMGQAYAHEEIMDVYQLVRVPPEARSLLFSAKYQIEPGRLDQGGGYIALAAYRGRRPQLLLLFDWSQTPRANNKHLGQYLSYAALGGSSRSDALAKLGEAEKALFWEIPASENQWHSIQVDVNQAYRQAMGDPDATVPAIDRVLVTAGVWCSSRKGAMSGAFFDDFSLRFEPSPDAVRINNEPVQVTYQAFKTDLGTGRK